MNAKIFSSKKAFFWKNCKDLKWIALAQTFILLISYPMMLLFAHKSTDREMIDFGQSLFNSTGTSHNTFILLIFPFLVGLISFRYLQNPGDIIRVHSSPVTRKQLLTEHGLSGLLMSMLPYVVTTALTYLIGLTLPHGTVELVSLIEWFGFSIFMSAIFFYATVFSGMIIGNSILQGVFTYILLLLPAGLNLLVSYHLNIFLKGYMGNFFTYQNYLSPMSGFLVTAQRISLHEVPFHFWVLSVGYLIAFITLSYWLYERRSLENVGQTIQFSCLIPYLKGLGVFCSILSLGALFKEFTADNSAILIGFVFGAVVSYILFEMIIQRTLRCQLSLKYLAVTMVSFALLFALVAFDVLGYGNKAIALENIQSVEFLSTDYNTYIEPNEGWISDPEVVKAVSHLYEKTSASVTPLYWLDNNLYRKPVFTFGFKDKTGHWFTRQYYVDAALMSPELEAVYASRPYLETRIPYLKIQSADIESVRLTTPLGEKTISDPAVIQSVFSAVQSDIYEHPKSALNNDVVPLTELYISIPVTSKSFPYKSNYNSDSDERVDFAIPILPEYQKALSQIDQAHSFSALLLGSKNLEKILIKKIAANSNGSDDSNHDLYQREELSEKDPSVVVISNPKALSTILSKPLYHSPKKIQDYQIRYVLKDGPQSSPEFIDGYLYQEDFPESLN